MEPDDIVKSTARSYRALRTNGTREPGAPPRPLHLPSTCTMTLTVAALYRFTPLEAPANIKGPLTEVCDAHRIRGTLLLAHEGINGTIAGEPDGISAVLDWIRTNIPDCATLDVKFSYAESNPFLRMKVRLKNEIVTMGVSDIDPNQSVGTYVDASDWNTLISDPDVVVIDTRNDYEVEIGTFQGAINPRTETFRDFPKWAQSSPDLPLTQRNDGERPKKVAMFCTGGIRCEKSTAYLKQQGVEEVYHLKGGILKYLETVPENDSLWEGECFVFDQRVAVKHGLKVGIYDQCFACRYPITQEDKGSPHYVAGVSCPRCHNQTDTKQKTRFAERQKQMTLAKTDGRIHLGSADTRRDTSEADDV